MLATAGVRVRLRLRLRLQVRIRLRVLVMAVRSEAWGCDCEEVVGGSTVSLAGHKVSEESQNHCKCWTNLALHARGWRVLLSKTSFVWGRGRERMRRGERGRGESRKWEVAAGCLRVLDTPSTLHFLIKFLHCKCKMNLAHSHMSSPCLKVVTATGGWTQGQAEWLALVSCCGLPMALACLRFYSPATAVSCILSLPFSFSLFAVPCLLLCPPLLLTAKLQNCIPSSFYFASD